MAEVDSDIVQLVEDHPGEFDKKIATGLPMNTAGSQEHDNALH